LQEFTAAVSPKTFDFIICNPPFFHNHLQSQQKARNDARHSVSLSKPELAEAVYFLLKEDGMFCVMYPKSEWEDWLKVCSENDLFAREVLFVKPAERSEPNRVIGIFSKKNNQYLHSETLVIYEENKAYTPAFKTLLQPYYLAL
jgi:tRNA1Val (adenine37-N6)-methyltransferase